MCCLRKAFTVNLVRWFTTPDTPSTNKKNFLNVQIDAIGIGLANAASPFLPVFLTYLGATNLQVGLLTSMPAVTGFILAILIGNFLQTRRNIIPWFSLARLMVVATYALTGVITLILPREYSITGVLLIWAAATLPQTVVTIAFSVVMNAVAGPTGRFELMTRRWSILGFTSAITVILVGQVIDWLKFPVNYQVVFIALSIGGLISYYFSSHIQIPDNPSPSQKNVVSFKEQVSEYFHMVRQEKPFLSFIAKRFVFLTGITLAVPLFPLYYVREVKATASWIGIISTAQTAVLIVGYFMWMRQSRSHGTRRVLLLTTLGVSLFPALVSQTHQVWLIAIIAGLAGIFQAGMDLVFFDELMKTVPVRYSATFVSIAQSLMYLSSIIAPILGTTLADKIGLSGALLVSAAVRLVGFGLFALGKPAVAPVGIPEVDIEG